MSNLTWFLISGALAALILAGEGVWTWWTHHRLADAPAEVLWEDTVTFPALDLPQPDVDGWSAHVGRTAWDLLAEARRRVANEAWAELMLSGLDDAPILAELVARQSVLAIEPAPQRELTGAQA